MAQAIDAGAEYERKRPARNASLESDVFVPGLQATITGLLSGLAGSGVAAIVHQPYPVWAVGLVVGAGAWGLAWVSLLREHRALLWEIERVTRSDLDGDGIIGAPGQEPTVTPDITRIEIVEHPAKNSTRFSSADFPISPERLSALARDVLNGVPLSEAELVTHRKLISGPKFRALQDLLIERGFAAWKNADNHRLGIGLTYGGQALFRQLSNVVPNAPTPPPQGAGE